MKNDKLKMKSPFIFHSPLPPHHSSFVIRHSSFVIRIISLLTTVLLLAKCDIALPRFSPWVALCAVALRAFSLWLIAAAIIAFVSLVIPRFFCGWLCPVGTCRDLLTFRRAPWRGLTRFPALGIWLAALGVGAALLKAPLFFWLDPLVIVQALGGLFRPGPLTVTDWLAALTAPLLLLLLLILLPGLWCGKLCPLGALQTLLYALPRAFRRRGGTAPLPQRGVGRRAFLGIGIGAATRALLPPHAEPPHPIRPPGTEEEARFLRQCARCGACAKACPVGLIRFGGSGTGLAAWLAPELSFENDACPPSCTACGTVCPTGAIRPFTPATKFARPLGIARWDPERCRSSQSQECGTCANACPHGALDLQWDPVNLSSRVAVKADACVGCGSCEYVCPETPKAIRVVARK